MGVWIMIRIELVLQTIAISLPILGALAYFGQRIAKLETAVVMVLTHCDKCNPERRLIEL